MAYIVLRSHDVLVHHPYESFATSVEAFVGQAQCVYRQGRIPETFAGLEQARQLRRPLRRLRALCLRAVLAACLRAAR